MDNPPAFFIFTNLGSMESLFLPTFQRDDIFVEIPKNKIKPGERDTVFVYYFTSEIGEFQKSVELFTNNSEVPVKLTVKGNILSLDPKAFISCPGFAPKIERVDDLALIFDSIPQEFQTVKLTNDTMIFEKPDERVSTQPSLKEDNSILPANQYAPNNIVFLIDVSSSMKKPNKLPLLKISMKNLAGVLREIDFISVVIYSTTSSVLLQPTIADKKNIIIPMIDSLKTSGTTNGVKGLQTAYEIAGQNFIAGGNNQIIIATDGLFNNPGYSKDEVFALAREKTKSNIILSVVGFGQDEDAIRMMKKLAEKGNGSFMQIPTQEAADEILINEIKLQSALTNKQ